MWLVSVFSFYLLFFIVFIVVFLIFLLSGFFVVQQQTNAVVERFGRFKRIAKPGLNWRIPLVDKITGRVNLRILQLDVEVETKTKDNVFVRIIVSVQYFVSPDNVYKAFYSLDNTNVQITSFVFDVVRAKVPSMLLDEVFEKKDDIANAVKTELASLMDDFGYTILKSLVTDINPDNQVKAAMNEINASQRLRVAAAEKAEAEKFLKVKAAEAEAESKALQGQGIAGQRKAIIEGLRTSVDDFQKSIPGASAQDIMNLVLITQYFDTLKEIGGQAKTNTILIPHSPGGMKEFVEQIRDTIITANEVGKQANG